MSQSIDFSAVTDATFNGATVDEIKLNGTSIWTKPLAYPTGQAEIFGPSDGVRPFGSLFTGPSSNYNHFSYTGSMAAIEGDGISFNSVLKTSTAQMRFGESKSWAIAHLQPTSQGYYLPSTLSVPSYNHNGYTNFWNGISQTALYTKLGSDNTIEVWMTSGVSNEGNTVEYVGGDLTYASDAQLRASATGMSAAFDGTGDVNDRMAPAVIRGQYLYNSDYSMGVSGNPGGIKLGYFDATKTFIVDEKITTSPKAYSRVYTSTDQYGNVLTHGIKYEFWRADDNSLYYTQTTWYGDPRPYNWEPINSDLATTPAFKWLRKLEGPINGTLAPYEDGAYLTTTTPYSNESGAFHRYTCEWSNGQLTGKYHWHSTKQNILRLP